MDHPHHKRTKNSYGILLCRYNQEKRCYEFLLEQRPYRYGFVQFITHHYHKADHDIIIALMNDMTPEDKAAIATLNFDTCYHRIYKQIPAPGGERYQRYLVHKTHFERTFLSDGGRWLLEMLSRTGRNALHWDIPRGRKAYAAERDLTSAVREFYEETHIPQGDYTIIDPEPVVQRFDSFGWSYANYFYLAVLANKAWNNPRSLRVDYAKSHQHTEVMDLRWVGLQELRVLDTYERLHPFLKAVTAILKKYKIAALGV